MSAAAERMGLELDDLREMIDEVLKDCQEKSELLKQAADAARADEVKSIAHDIKGSTANYGLSVASELALIIEKRSQDLPKETILELAEYLNSLTLMNLGQDD